MVSDQKIFSCFPHISLCKICVPQLDPILASLAKLNKLGRCSLGDATSLISRLLAFGVRQEGFFTRVTPRAGAFLALGKLVKQLLENKF